MDAAVLPFIGVPLNSTGTRPPTRWEVVLEPSRVVQSRDTGAGHSYHVWREALGPSPLVAELAKLRNVGDRWDSSGAPAPNEQAIHNAGQVLALALRLIEPQRLALSAEGGVAVCFIEGDRYADIEALNSGEVLGVTSDRRSEPQVWEVSLDDAGDRAALKRIREFLES